VEEPIQSLESRVLNTIIGAFKSREVLEAEWPADAPPLDDDRVLLNNWATLAQRQGSVLAHLAMVAPTRADLMARMPGVVDRAPAWLDARLHGEPMTWRIFMTGLAQIATVHREAIEQVVSEQVSDPEPITETLAEAPIPAATPNEDRSALMRGVIEALFAHTKALAGIAYDLEVTAGQWPERNEDWDDPEQ
jgi:hypothetical protein